MKKVTVFNNLFKLNEILLSMWKLQIKEMKKCPKKFSVQNYMITIIFQYIIMTTKRNF